MQRAQQCPRHSCATTDEDELLLKHLRSAARTFAEDCIGRVAFDVVQRVFLEEFVVCAYQSQLHSQSERATQAQVGWLTGIGPESVRSVLNRTTTSPFAEQPIAVADRVIWLWRNDPAYLEKDRITPARLLVLGGRGTFQGLVSRVVRGITPQIALSSLMARGWVECVDSHWVRLTRINSRVRIDSHAEQDEPSEPSARLAGCHLQGAVERAQRGIGVARPIA